MDKIYEYLEEYRNYPHLYERNRDFVETVYNPNFTAEEVWIKIGRWDALTIWNHSRELIDRELLGEDKWMEIHNLIDSAKESI